MMDYCYGLSGSQGGSLLPSPLRTVLATFTAHGSSVLHTSFSLGVHLLVAQHV